MKKSYITPALLVRDIKINTILAGSGNGPEKGEGGKGKKDDEADAKFLDFNFDDAE